MSIESSLETAPPSENPAAEDNASLKKRGAFLTRRFFGGQDKKSLLPVETADPVAPVPGSLAYTAATVNEPARAEATDAVEPTTPLPAPPSASIPADPPPAPDPLPATEPRTAIPTASEPPSRMNPTESVPSTTGRASAQLTLPFEVTSLQLTPYFRLGSVQLRAISNVVSLHLIAAQQTDGPLAAGISFQIERVELDDKARFKSILLKPLGESRAAVELQPTLQVDHVALAGETADAPISVTTSGAAPTVVQLVGTFAIGAMEFTPAFEIDSLRLEPASPKVRLRVAPDSSPGAAGLPPAFEVAEVQLGEDARIGGLRAVPGTSDAA